MSYRVTKNTLGRLRIPNGEIVGYNEAIHWKPRIQPHLFLEMRQNIVLFEYYR